jgi:hypothetical protein
MEKQIIQKLIHSIKCSKCGERYEAENIDIIENKDDKWFLSIFCPICQKQLFVIVIIGARKQIEIATDLNEEELVTFANASDITTDYMLDLHNFLKDFSGDFIELFDINNVNTE